MPPATSEEIAQRLIDNRDAEVINLRQQLSALCDAPLTPAVLSQIETIRSGIISYLTAEMFPQLAAKVIDGTKAGYLPVSAGGGRSMGSATVATREHPSEIAFVATLAKELSSVATSLFELHASTSDEVWQLGVDAHDAYALGFFDIGLGNFKNGRPVFSTPQGTLANAVLDIAYEGASAECDLFLSIPDATLPDGTTLLDACDSIDALVARLTDSFNALADMASAHRWQAAAFASDGYPLQVDEAGKIAPAVNASVRNASAHRARCPAPDVLYFSTSGPMGGLLADLERATAGRATLRAPDGRVGTSVLHLIHELGCLTYPFTLGYQLVKDHPRLTGHADTANPDQVALAYEQRFGRVRSWPFMVQQRRSEIPSERRQLFHPHVLEMYALPGLDAAARHLLSTQRPDIARIARDFFDMCTGFEPCRYLWEKFAPPSRLLSCRAPRTVDAILGYPHLSKALSERSRLAISGIVAVRAIEMWIEEARKAQHPRVSAERLADATMEISLALDDARVLARWAVEPDLRKMDGPRYVAFEEPVAAIDEFEVVATLLKLPAPDFQRLEHEGSSLQAG